MPVLDELLVRIGMDTTGVDEGTDEVTSRLDGLAGPAAAAGLAAGAVFAVGLSSAMDIAEAQSRLQNQLGLTETEAARAGGIAGDVFSAGFGESLSDVADSVAAVTSNIGGLGEVTDAELEQMSKAALALAKTFEFDVAESTQAMGTLIKSGLAKDGVEALDLLTATAEKLPPALREELPVLTKEYGEFFEQLGFTGPDMMGLLAEAAKNPIFEIDKVGDALKELSLRLADTEAAKEPLKELGLDVKEIQKLVNEGQGTKAFDQIVTALKDVDDQTERTRLQAALFGGPGEDMGNTLLELSASGSAAANGLDKAAGASGKLTDGMEDDPAQQMDKAMRTFSMTLGEALLPLLLKLSNFMAENQGLMKTLIPIVLGVVAVLGIMAAVIWLVNIAMAANPIAWIILGIVALIAAIALIIIKWDEVKASTLKVWSIIVAGLAAAWDWITRKAGEFWGWLSGIFSDGWNWIVRNVWDPVRRFFTQTIPGWVDKGLGWIEDKWNGAISFFAGIPGRLASGARGMWNFITDGLKSALNGAIGIVNSGIFFINDKLISNVNRLPGVNIPWIPYIPYLAEGGVTTGPTLAMIGEGSEQEAVLPLSKLEQLISVGGGGEMRAPSVSKVQPARMTVAYEPGGGDSFTEWLMETIRIRFDGDVNRLGEEGR